MNSPYLIPLIIDIIVNALSTASIHLYTENIYHANCLILNKGNMTRMFRCMSPGVWTICSK